ncbi:MAG: PorP/SprF family type IX secretion system membrane protein [Bacteroidia bacterium]|nr:PorP/SprF family type IX secretion system membrane protein [Bacteroidia bacterium]
MIKKIVILIIMLADCTSKSYCQDPQFSQYYANQLYLSPSYAGSTDGCRVISNFRDQWLKIPGSFITYSCSFDYFLYKLNSGVGFLFLSDQAGSGRLRTTNLGFQYSYNIHIKKDWVIRPGLQYYYTQRSFDLSKLIFVDQVSIHGMSPGTSESFPVQKVDYFDCSASVIGYSENKWAGFTIDHLVKNNQSFLRKKSSVPVKYSLFGGVKILLKGKSKKDNEESLFLSCLYQRQNDFNQFEITPYWHNDPFIPILV